jgi:Rrf2 family protein
MLKISKQVDYGLQFLIALEEYSEKNVLSVRKFCEDNTISFLFLQKIVRLLRDAGIVASIQGASGGYYLLRQLSDINLKEVIEAVEGPYGITSCQKEGGCCDIAKKCYIRPAIEKMNQDITAYIERVTIKEFVSSI